MLQGIGRLMPGRCGEALHGVRSPKSPALDPLVSLLDTEFRRLRSLRLSEVGGTAL